MNLWNTFAARADADPAADALIFSDGVISFGELKTLATRCLGYLRAQGIRQRDVVALQLPKRRESYALLLACLHLGAPYVFLDPKNPPDRSARVIDRVRPAILFTETETSNPHGRVQRVLKGDRLDWLAEYDCDAAPSDITVMDPAYIMFTSGSTGEPKGAVIPHQGVLSLMAWARRVVHRHPKERFTNINPLHFDNSVFDIYCGLLNGAALAPIETGELANPAVWIKAARTAAATVMFAVPTLFLLLDELGLLKPETLPDVATFLFGGEGYPIGRLRDFHARFAERSRLINVYGPTETSCICSSVELTSEILRTTDSEFPPLGRMHDDFSHVILDDGQQQVSPGVTGELWIGGPNVGLGYYDNPEETAARFRQDPRQQHYRSIYYRTGDLIRQDGQGQLWFHGRVDNQVKLRGHRVELEEVDLVVQSIADVRRAVTVVLAGVDGNELGVAFVADRPIAAAAVYNMCKEKLPSYMHPAVVAQLGSLPLNANGKVDRLATTALLQREKRA